jgi:hypothetical protein
MFAERFDRFDHAPSAEEMAMTLQSLNKARRRFGAPADRRKKGAAVRTRQNHALMLVEQPARPLPGRCRPCQC